MGGLRCSLVLYHLVVSIRALAFLLALPLLACRPSESDTSDAAPAGAAAEPQAKSSDASQAEPRLEAPTAPDPERAAKLADLDALCAAIDHDYKDGTLGDYYAKVEPTTAWGKAQREAGNASVTPGRLLEKAVAELSPGASDPALGSCRTLLDYLDDVE